MAGAVPRQTFKRTNQFHGLIRSAPNSNNRIRDLSDKRPFRPFHARASTMVHGSVRCIVMAVHHTASKQCTYRHRPSIHAHALYVLAIYCLQVTVGCSTLRVPQRKQFPHAMIVLQRPMDGQQTTYIRTRAMYTRNVRCLLAIHRAECTA